PRSRPTGRLFASRPRPSARGRCRGRTAGSRWSGRGPFRIRGPTTRRRAVGLASAWHPPGSERPSATNPVQPACPAVAPPAPGPVHSTPPAVPPSPEGDPPMPARYDDDDEDDRPVRRARFDDDDGEDDRPRKRKKARKKG